MRRTRLFNVIAIATFLSLLLPLLVGCSSQYETASATIPDGWEAVSTSGKVTHLRLKEGSDAYHYMEINQRSFRGSYKFLDMEIAGNPENRAIRPNENGNIYVILYYGHMWMKYDQATDQYVMSEPPAPEDDKLYRINMSYIPDAGYPHHLAELGQLDAENSLTLESLSSEQDGVRIGFSNAIMVPIHVSELNTGWDSIYFNILSYSPSEDTANHDVGSSASMYCAVYYSQFDDAVFFQNEELDALQRSFPYFFCTYYPLVNFILAGIAIVLSVMAVRKRWSPIYPIIPCLVGIYYNWMLIPYWSSVPANDYIMGNLGQIVFAFLFLLLHVLLGIVLLAVHLILKAARKRKARQQALEIIAAAKSK